MINKIPRTILLIGLGNPTINRSMAGTRHNIGADILYNFFYNNKFDNNSYLFNINTIKNPCNVESTITFDTYVKFDKINADNCLLNIIFNENNNEQFNKYRIIVSLCPSIMNFSGHAVRRIIDTLHNRNVEIDKIIIVCDDIETQFGIIKLVKSKQPNSISKGHNGLKNIELHLPNEEFYVIKIGVGRPIDKISVPEYVLSNFPNYEERSMMNILHEFTNKFYELLSFFKRNNNTQSDIQNNTYLVNAQ